jgi:hypothetical protein
VALNGYQRAVLARAGEVWVAANRHMAAVIERVPACEARDAVHDRRRPSRCTLEYVMQDYVAHMKRHLEQIAAG